MSDDKGRVGPTETREQKLIAVEKAFIHVEEVMKFARYHIASSADQHDRLMHELIDLMRDVLTELRRSR